MRCQKCGRMLLRTGIQVQMHGFVITVGPTCAQNMGAKPKPRRQDGIKMRAVRARRVDQLALFGEAG